MKQEVLILPVRCKGCNTVFDLWKVLQSEQASGTRTPFYQLLNQSFCPNCRRAVLLGMTEQGDEEMGENENEYQVTLELE